MPRLLRPLAASLALVACLGLPATAGEGPALLVHGNYCGPGNNAPLPPVDDLDAACARHDACTPDGGLPSRACNARLAAEAGAVARDPREPRDVRSAAGFVAGVAGLIPSGSGRDRAYVGPSPSRGEVVLRHPELLQDLPPATVVDDGDDGIE